MRWKWRRRGKKLHFPNLKIGFMIDQVCKRRRSDYWWYLHSSPSCTCLHSWCHRCHLILFFNQLKLTCLNSGPRLVITHIENENFKSYAGVQVMVHMWFSLGQSSFLGIGSFPQELHKHRGSKWKWKIQRDRLNALCLWVPRTEDQSR